ncbi:MAG: DUF2330 domain-containing protein [Myxococcota bacterium]
MGCFVREGLVALSSILVLLGMAAPAHADVFAARGTAPVTATQVEVLLTDSGDGQYQVLEQLWLRSEVSKLVWIRPLPARATIEPGPDLFAELSAATVPRVPLANAVRARPFGPSVVTLAADRLWPASAAPQTRARPEARALEVDALELFSGEARTSSVTGEVFLPPDLERFLTRHDAPLSTVDRRTVSGWLRRGAVLMALAAYDRLPSDRSPSRLGPFLMTFSGDQPLYPLARRSTDELEIVFDVLASGARVPQQLPLASAGGPPAPGGQATLVYAGAVAEESELDLRLVEHPELRLPASRVLTRTRLQTETARLDAVSFGASPPGADPIEVQTDQTPGTAGDLLLCLLLGLAPLILAPESWLILWIQERARDVARRGGSTLGVKLWALWCFGVAAYWFFTLEGLARVAALGPLILGTAQLALPFTERIPSPFRAEIRKPPGTKDLQSGTIRPS